MGRHKKDGLEFFYLDTEIFLDDRIKALIGRFGSFGFAFYIYILCTAYKWGYYFHIDEDWIFSAARELSGDTAEAVKVLFYLVKKGLLDEEKMRLYSVATSRGIQLRYQTAVKTRAAKRKVTVNGKYWILTEEETQRYIEVGEDFLSEKNGDFSSEKLPFFRGDIGVDLSLFHDKSENNDDFSAEKYSFFQGGREKKRKEKEKYTKEKEIEKKREREKGGNAKGGKQRVPLTAKVKSGVDRHAFGQFENVFLTEGERRSLEEKYTNASLMLESFSCYKKASGKKYDDDYAALCKIALKDGERRRAAAVKKPESIKAGVPPSDEVRAVFAGIFGRKEEERGDNGRMSLLQIPHHEGDEGEV